MAFQMLARAVTAALRLFPRVRQLERDSNDWRAAAEARKSTVETLNETVATLESAGDQLAASNQELLAALRKTESDLQRLATGDVTLEKLAVENGTMTVEMGTKMTHFLAATFATLLREKGGENYLEMNFHERADPDNPGFEPLNIAVCIHRYEKKSPHEKRLEAEAKLAKVRAELDGVFALWTKWREEATTAQAAHEACGHCDGAERFRAVANTYLTCETNLREALDRAAG